MTSGLNGKAMGYDIQGAEHRLFAAKTVCVSVCVCGCSRIIQFKNIKKKPSKQWQPLISKSIQTLAG